MSNDLSSAVGPDRVDTEVAALSSATGEGTMTFDSSSIIERMLREGVASTGDCGADVEPTETDQIVYLTNAPKGANPLRVP